jgi:hypothetical protein
MSFKYVPFGNVIPFLLTVHPDEYTRQKNTNNKKQNPILPLISTHSPTLKKIPQNINIVPQPFCNRVVACIGYADLAALMNFAPVRKKGDFNAKDAKRTRKRNAKKCGDIF